MDDSADDVRNATLFILERLSESGKVYRNWLESELERRFAVNGWRVIQRLADAGAVQDVDDQTKITDVGASLRSELTK